MCDPRLNARQSLDLRVDADRLRPGRDRRLAQRRVAQHPERRAERLTAGRVERLRGERRRRQEKDEGRHQAGVHATY